MRANKTLCRIKTGPDKTTLYLHVWDWPANRKLSVPSLKNQVLSAYLLKPNFFGRHRKLESDGDANGWVISVPKTAPDKISSTIVLEIQGAPKIEL